MKRYYFSLLFVMNPLAAMPQSAKVPINITFNSTAATMKSASPATIDSLKGELRKAKADTLRMWLMMQLGNTYRVQNLDSSRWYAQKGVALAQAIQHKQGELFTGLSLALALAERDIPLSMRTYLHILQQAQLMNNSAAIHDCYFGMGLLQLYLGNYRQALVNYQQAKKFALLTGSKTRVAISVNEIGNIYLWLQKPDSARYHFTFSASYYPPIQQNGVWLYYMARLDEAKNPKQAQWHFQHSIHQFNTQQNLRGAGFAYRWYSEFLWKHNQPDASILAARLGLKAGQRIGNFRVTLVNSTLLTQYYQTLNRTDSAYRYQQIMLAARDSLFSQDKINQIQTTLIGEQQRVQLLEQQKNQFENNVKIYGLMGLVVSLLLIAGLFYRNDRQKQKLNSRLKDLNGEVTLQKEEIQYQRDHLAQTLANLKSTQAQLIQREKMASLGELTAGIAHEIQNPLNFVNNFSELSTELVEEMNEEVDKENMDEIKLLSRNIKENLTKITHHGKRASSIVKGMLEHSRTSSGQKELTDLNALCADYLQLTYQGMRRSEGRTPGDLAKNETFTCELVTGFDPNLGNVEIAPQEIGRVLLNVYTNAFYAVRQRAAVAKKDETYTPTVWVTTYKLSNTIEIRVKDNGTGIAESVKAKIFQPFFTTKPTGEGTGLGLSLSYDIVVKGHGGKLLVESQEGLGTEFIIELPIPA